MKPLLHLWACSPCLGSRARVSLQEAAMHSPTARTGKATRQHVTARLPPPLLTSSLLVSSCELWRGTETALLLHETWALLLCDLSAACGAHRSACGTPAFLPRLRASRSSSEVSDPLARCLCCWTAKCGGAQDLVLGPMQADPSGLMV